MTSSHFSNRSKCVCLLHPSHNFQQRKTNNSVFIKYLSASPSKMKFTILTTALNLGLLSTVWFVPSTSQEVEDGSGNMVKMCLWVFSFINHTNTIEAILTFSILSFYDSPSGHARTDPIITTTDLSDHVHTFYGPLNFHPDTSHDDLRNTGNSFTSSPWVENQSLYWVRENIPIWTRQIFYKCLSNKFKLWCITAPQYLWEDKRYFATNLHSCEPSKDKSMWVQYIFLFLFHMLVWENVHLIPHPSSYRLSLGQ